MLFSHNHEFSHHSRRLSQYTIIPYTGSPFKTPATTGPSGTYIPSAGAIGIFVNISGATGYSTTSTNCGTGAITRGGGGANIAAYLEVTQGKNYYIYVGGVGQSGGGGGGYKILI